MPYKEQYLYLRLHFYIHIHFLDKKAGPFSGPERGQNRGNLGNKNLLI